MPHTTLPRHQGGLRPYLSLLLLALCVFAGEILIGLAIGSLALISDASHTLGDSIAVLLALWFEFGYHARSESVNNRRRFIARLGIGTIILIASFRIGLEGYERISVPHPTPPGIWVILTALGCVGMNRLMLRALGKCDCHIDDHLRTHIKSDIWISVAVAVGGVATIVTGNAIIDAILSLGVALWIGVLGLQVILDKHHH